MGCQRKKTHEPKPTKGRGGAAKIAEAIIKQAHERSSATQTVTNKITETQKRGQGIGQ